MYSSLSEKSISFSLTASILLDALALPCDTLNINKTNGGYEMITKLTWNSKPVETTTKGNYTYIACAKTYDTASITSMGDQYQIVQITTIGRAFFSTVATHTEALIKALDFVTG